MKVLKNLDSVQLHNSVVTLGKFDGFHLGHQKLIKTAMNLKQQGQADTMVIFTFDIHPRQILEHDNIQAIQTWEERENDISPSGIDYLIAFPFNRETMAMEPETFAREILVRKLDAKIIVCGEDFRFGRYRRGDVDLLRELGFQVVVVPKVRVRIDDEDTDISSTRIREEILRGRMEEVRAMMGRPYSITGEVRQGKHLGRTIGFPTLNQEVPANKILPPDGVYITRTTIPGSSSSASSSTPPSAGKIYHGITNIGSRPTFDDGEQKTVETHLIGFDGDLYGRTVIVEFCHYLRPEMKFAGAGELVEQMKKDKEEAVMYFRREE